MFRVSSTKHSRVALARLFGFLALVDDFLRGDVTGAAEDRVRTMSSFTHTTTW